MRVRTALGILLGIICLLMVTAPRVVAQTNALGWMAYIQEGDIWTKELPEGDPKQLTHDGKISTPRISPSGQWIAYWSKTKCDERLGCIYTPQETHLWVMGRSGENAREIPGCAPAWALTSDMLYCAANDGTLSIVRAPNFVPEVILTPMRNITQTYFSGVVWSPDSSALAYTRDDVIEPGAPALVRSSLWRINSTTHVANELLNLGEPSQDGLMAAGWTPDAKGILYWIVPYFSGSFQADGLAFYFIPAQGGTSKQLVEAMLTYRDFMSFAPRANAMAVAAGSGRGSWTNKRIVVYDFDKETESTLTEKNVAAISPAWSPTKTQIAYVAMPDEGDLVGGNDARLGLRKRRIWLMNLDGTNKRQLTHDDASRDEYPQWANDGTQILFARIFQPDTQDDAADHAELWLMRADGTGLEKILDLNEVIANSLYGEKWFGYYGHIAWDDYFDWWQPPKTNLPVTGDESPDVTLWIFSGLVCLAFGASALIAAQIKNRKPEIELYRKIK